MCLGLAIYQHNGLGEKGQAVPPSPKPLPIFNTRLFFLYAVFFVCLNLMHALGKPQFSIAIITLIGIITLIMHIPHAAANICSAPVLMLLSILFMFSDHRTALVFYFCIRVLEYKMSVV